MIGRHRHPLTLQLTSVFALMIALSAGVVMLAGRPDVIAPPVPAAELTIEQAYPGVTATPVPKKLQDGAPFTPLYFVNDRHVIGTAPFDKNTIRLVLFIGQDERELRRLKTAQNPDFAGFAGEGERLAWMELTTTDDGRSQTLLWTIDNSAATPRVITSDTGDVMLFDKRDDVVIHEGKVTWLAAADSDTPRTEIRTVSLSGGKVSVDTQEGAYLITVWPWLSTVNLGDDGPIELRNMETDERIKIAVNPNELVACSPVWCRALIIGTEASSTVIELAKTDGSLRLRTAAGSVAAAIVDVALLDRYEIYSHSGGKLTLFDLEERRTIVIARNISQVASRGPVLWWSTGDNETTTWHVLDLRNITKR